MYINQSPYRSAQKQPYQNYPYQVPTTTIYVDPNKIQQPQPQYQQPYQQQYQQYKYQPSPSTDYGYRDSQLQHQYQDLTKKYQELQFENSQLMKQLSDRPPQQSELLNQKLQYYIVENEKMKQQLVYAYELQEKLGLVTNQLEKVNEALILSNQENEQLIQQINEYKAQQGYAFQLNSTIQSYEIQLSQKGDQLRNLQQEIDVYQQLLQQKTMDIQSAQMEINSHIGKNQMLQQEIEQLKRNTLKLKQEIMSSQVEQSQLSQLKHDNMQMNDKYSELLRNYEQLKAINGNLVMEMNKQQQIDTYIDQLVEQLNDHRSRLELATQNILLYQNKLNEFEFMANEKGQLEVQHNHLKQNYQILENDYSKLTELLKQKQIELDVNKNTNMQFSQKLQQIQGNNVLVNELKLEIEQWKSKLGRMDQMFNEAKKEDQFKLKCLQEQNAQLQQIINNLQEKLQSTEAELQSQNRVIADSSRKLREKDQQLNYQSNKPNVDIEEMQALKNRLKVLEQSDEKNYALQKEVQRLNALTSQLRQELTTYKNKQHDYQFMDEQYKKTNQQVQELKSHIAQIQK